jgi:regulator of RNase E activity RraA
MVGDGDGVVVLPPGIAADVLADAQEQEKEEEFVAAQVVAGERIEGLYPLGERWRPAYQAWLAERNQ